MDTSEAPADTVASANPRASPAATDHHALPAETIDRHGEDPDFVTALARGLAVLLSLSDKRRHMSIAQVAHLTGIPRAAARRSLHTLAKLGFVAVDDARRFYLRPRVLSFSHAYLSSSPVAVAAQPILDRLGESLHEACSLAMLDGDEIVYVARSTTSRIMSPALNVGRRLPAYCTSIGHVLLAHLPPEDLDAYLARARFHPYTEHTPTTPARVRAIVKAAHDKGYAFASQLMEPRLCTLAVPVRDAGGHYVAGINVIVQGRLMSDAEMAERYLRPMQQAALELGALLLP
ncbi:MAG: helix-turn-helix domain-containing protein [Betaproteobacteria bacterium]|jgi:IclR family pca regulon transcriptional regulator|nr:helix-turn-helix domain-containing protein [Betaproteobacteria bacterium]MDH5285960.1 helix-turn-helix domain-containing protein [Betaproteobacteria bacterium]